MLKFNTKHLIFIMYLILYNIQFYQRLPFKRKGLSYRKNKKTLDHIFKDKSRIFLLRYLYRSTVCKWGTMGLIDSNL